MVKYTLLVRAWLRTVAPNASETAHDAFYDRGSTFLLKKIPNDGVPRTQNSQKANLVSENDLFRMLGPWDYSLGCGLIFAQVTFG